MPSCLSPVATSACICLCLQCLRLSSLDLWQITWGKAESSRPIKSELDITGSRSATSEDTYPNGFEFRIPSISITTVLSTSSVTFCAPMVVHSAALSPRIHWSVGSLVDCTESRPFAWQALFPTVGESCWRLPLKIHLWNWCPDHCATRL